MIEASVWRPRRSYRELLFNFSNNKTIGNKMMLSYSPAKNNRIGLPEVVRRLESRLRIIQICLIKRNGYFMEQMHGITAGTPA
ncbi:MAG: hypothetical protein FMNOHCHN_02155 [Ignavibacteriaceae bacterium]|nr:hypothetical protein [Ignavibacteriaceae bacterium]